MEKFTRYEDVPVAEWLRRCPAISMKQQLGIGFYLRRFESCLWRFLTTFLYFLFYVCFFALSEIVVKFSRKLLCIIQLCQCNTRNDTVGWRRSPWVKSAVEKFPPLFNRVLLLFLISNLSQSVPFLTDPS